MNSDNTNKSELKIKLEDTLNLFYDLKNTSFYEDCDNSFVKKMLNNTYEVLNNPDIDVTELKDEKGRNLLHLAAESSHLDYFIKAAHKGINPYLNNDKRINAFQSGNYNFANSFWQKFNNIYFDDKIVQKSFSQITKGFHPLLKQSIYKENIKNNTSHYNLDEISHFLKEENIYSHHNVLFFAIHKFNSPLEDLLHFIHTNKTTLTPQDNSLALRCGLKNMGFKKSNEQTHALFEQFIDESEFSLENDFFQSIASSVVHYSNSHFQSIIHKQIKILAEKDYDPYHSLDFHLNNYVFSHKSLGKISEDNQLHSFSEFMKDCKFDHFDSIFNYFKLQKQLENKNEKTNIKKTKF